MAEERQGLDPIQEAIRLFNTEYFFEAHEVLEDVWRTERGEPRLFLQGLIQVCAAYHHFQNGNLVGAVTLLERGSEKMRKYPAHYLGIDAGGLIAHVDENRKRIEAKQRGESVETTLPFPRIQTLGMTG
jgi:predicted metal-dependent hydrolase